MAIGKTFVVLAGALLASGRMLESSGSCSFPGYCLDQEAWICSSGSQPEAMEKMAAQCKACVTFEKHISDYNSKILRCHDGTTDIWLGQKVSGPVTCGVCAEGLCYPKFDVDCEVGTSSGPDSFTTSEEFEDYGTTPAESTTISGHPFETAFKSYVAEQLDLANREKELAADKVASFTHFDDIL